MIENNFDFYESCHIDEYSLTGRNKKHHLYSFLKSEWIESKHPISDFYSYNSCSGWYKKLIQWILLVLGFKKKQDKKIIKHFGKESLE